HGLDQTVCDQMEGLTIYRFDVSRLDNEAMAPQESVGRGKKPEASPAPASAPKYMGYIDRAKTLLFILSKSDYFKFISRLTEANGEAISTLFRFEPIEKDVLKDISRLPPSLLATHYSHNRGEGGKVVDRLKQLSYIKDKSIRDRLYPYQVEGILYIVGAPRYGRCMLGDEQGLGKTPQVEHVI
ncbi:hypothetical protein KIPB_010864, partial [Kipferlia bialata]